MQVLSDLELRLPEIQSQVAHIQQVYDSGRRKVSVAPSPSSIFPPLCLTINPLRSSNLRHIFNYAWPTMLRN